jgi:hypothetical protein
MLETFGRLSDHLAANNIDLAKTPVTFGLPLTVDPISERFVGADVATANALLRRPEYRKPFVVPEIV